MTTLQLGYTNPLTDVFGAHPTLGGPLDLDDGQTYTLVSPEEYTDRVASFYDQTVAEVYDLYQKRLFASNAVDFDDMLFLTVDVLERFPEAREKWQEAFRYVLVDEYQDTNHAQYRLLQLLAEKHRNVFAVGSNGWSSMTRTRKALSSLWRGAGRARR